MSIETEPGTVFGTIYELAKNDRIAQGERPFEVTIEEFPYYVWGKTPGQAKVRVVKFLRESASARSLTMADMFQAIKDKGE